MAIIEGIGDEVMLCVTIVIAAIGVMVAWLSTRVSVQPLDNERTSQEGRTPDPQSNNSNSESVAPDTQSSDTANLDQTQPETPASPGTALLADTPSSETAESPSSENPTSALPNELRQRRLNFLSGLGEAVQQGKQNTGTTAAGSNAGTATPAANNSATADTPNTDVAPPAGMMRLRVKFLTDRERLLLVRSHDTIMSVKRQHFARELSADKLVRFVYNGQQLQDAATLASLRITDLTTIHCLITEPQRQRSTASTGQTGDDTDMDNIDIGVYMLPLFGVILGLIWYLRIMWRGLFNPTSTVVLVGLTFIFLVACSVAWRAVAHERHTQPGGAHRVNGAGATVTN